MDPNKASWTAIAVILFRAYHREHNEDLVFDDPVAASLVTPEERDFLEKLCIDALANVDPELKTLPQPEGFDRFFHSFQAIPEILARARYNEDRLLAAVQGGMRQYVIVGAGLETFAIRRTDLSGSLGVFETDHPLTQAFKRERLEKAGFSIPANLHFAPIDLEQEDASTVLSRLSFDPGQPAFFSWLGVTQYLTQGAIEQTLTSIRKVAASGS
ncbi:MAG TPA: class I SAM-dependent methyltransferase, partial [Dehalococcoidia bacterium]|nr:class I SAM-dependent methyltransferase [Dehalococcoidia bacterium]